MGSLGTLIAAVQDTPRQWNLATGTGLDRFQLNSPSVRLGMGLETRMREKSADTVQDPSNLQWAPTVGMPHDSVNDLPLAVKLVERGRSFSFCWDGPIGEKAGARERSRWRA
jgi:hypothetical protein